MQDANQLTEVGGQFPDVGSRISKALELYGAFFVPFIVLSAISFPLDAISSAFEWGFILTLPAAAVSGLVSAALIVSTSKAILGKSPEAGADLSYVWSKFGQLFELFWRTVGTILLLAITIIGIPWAIRVGVRWFFGTQEVLLNDRSAKEAISESCRLVEGQWWRTFGNLLLVGLIIGVPSMIGFGISVGVSMVAGGIVGAAITTLTAPFSAIAYTLYYLRLRQEKGAPTVDATGMSPSPEPA